MTHDEEWDLEKPRHINWIIVDIFPLMNLSFIRVRAKVQNTLTKIILGFGQDMRRNKSLSCPLTRSESSDLKNPSFLSRAKR